MRPEDDAQSQSQGIAYIILHVGRWHYFDMLGAASFHMVDVDTRRLAVEGSVGSRRERGPGAKGATTGC